MPHDPWNDFDVTNRYNQGNPIANYFGMMLIIFGIPVILGIIVGLIESVR